MRITRLVRKLNLKQAIQKPNLHLLFGRNRFIRNQKWRKRRRQRFTSGFFADVRVETWTFPHFFLLLFDSMILAPENEEEEEEETVASIKD